MAPCWALIFFSALGIFLMLLFHAFNNSLAVWLVSFLVQSSSGA